MANQQPHMTFCGLNYVWKLAPGFCPVKYFVCPKKRLFCVPYLVFSCGMNETPRTSFTYALQPSQQALLEQELRNGNYTPVTVPHARVAADRPGCRIVLYTSGKCVVQGKGAGDWVAFVLEPQVLGAAGTGYEDVLDPQVLEPHMGIDESGKGDFFGPMVIAAAYTDASLVPVLRKMGVKDSKRISSDARARAIGRDLKAVLKGRHALVVIGPRAYNRLYAKIGSVNRLLAWGHARAIENLLTLVPDCPRAVADQFGPERQIRQALMKSGRSIELVQRHKAESDIAVAAASILARVGFLDALADLGERHGTPLPKGASAAVQTAARALVAHHGPNILLETAKCHFKTTDEVLAASGTSRQALDADGQVVSRSLREPPRRPAPARPPTARHAHPDQGTLF